MIDKRLYCETFSRLCVSEEAKKEVFQMMNETKRRARLPGILRAGAIAAAMTMALAVTAGAVDLATGGAFFQSLREVWSDGYETRYEAVDRDGNPLMVSVSQGATVHTTEDGHLLLRAAGEEVDITDAMAEEGAYHFEKETERRTVVVDIAGTLEDWTLTETVTGEDGVIYSSSFTSDDMPGDITISRSDAVGEGQEDGSVNQSFVTVTDDGEDGMTVTVEESGAVSYPGTSHDSHASVTRKP